MNTKQEKKPKKDLKLIRIGIFLVIIAIAIFSFSFTKTAVIIGGIGALTWVIGALKNIEVEIVPDEPKE